jgi:hypothetical protein
MRAQTGPLTTISGVEKCVDVATPCRLNTGSQAHAAGQHDREGVLTNIGGARPGETSISTSGHPPRGATRTASPSMRRPSPWPLLLDDDPSRGHEFAFREIAAGRRRDDPQVPVASGDSRCVGAGQPDSPWRFRAGSVHP